MKIQKLHLYGVNPYRAQDTKSDLIRNRQAVNDRLEISHTAKHLSGKTSFEEVRQQKVENLKNQVQDGSYEVDTRELAVNLLNQYRR
ncbi:flagellar biosynthesis anti-sigma factor FlgM [Savagea sp. SN6]|uniref:Negative regulator of flagellin synthesis n=1 Tax=Savagea serpentis TaxID=2785297 RepID=A0A8J7KHN4_9BACL|nr:flagellar biosynthesis anti-sigma factor FlgM [Savagea serpentis]MBF4501298.1 flagellar biosynthesis anti-sigma factor FlgM [Savagea serpentis]